MMRSSVVRTLTFICFGFITVGAPLAAQIKVVGSSSTMTMNDVLKLSRAGFSDDIIIQQIRRQGRPFNLSTDQLISLKYAGISDRVIQTMLTPSTQEVNVTTANATPSPAQPVSPTQSVQQAPSNSALPTEIGVYAKKQGQWVELLPEIVNFKTGGVLKSISTAGIVKHDINGHLNGKSSNNGFASPIEFVIVTPEGVAITEYQLLCLRQNGDNREFRTVTGGVLHVTGGATRDVLPFEWTKLSSRTYKVSFSSSGDKQEYGFLPPGAVTSASAASNGKLYSFRVVD